MERKCASAKVNSCVKRTSGSAARRIDLSERLRKRMQERKCASASVHSARPHDDSRPCAERNQTIEPHDQNIQIQMREREKSGVYAMYQNKNTTVQKTRDSSALRKTHVPVLHCA